MDEEQRLHTIVTQRRSKVSKPIALGGLISDYVGARVCCRQELTTAIADICRQLLPPELAEHCAITDVSMGRVEILVDSPVYLYEIRLRRGELLDEFRKCSRQIKPDSADGARTGVTAIKQVSFRPGSLEKGIRL